MSQVRFEREESSSNEPGKVSVLKAPMLLAFLPLRIEGSITASEFMKTFIQTSTHCQLKTNDSNSDPFLLLDEFRQILSCNVRQRVIVSIAISWGITCAGFMVMIEAPRTSKQGSRDSR